MIKTIAKILLAIAILWTLAFVFKLGNSFAMTSDQNEMYQGCVNDAQSHLGKTRAKQYCKCTVIMVTDRYTIDEIKNDGQLSEKDQLIKYGFAANYCNKNANAPTKKNSNDDEFGKFLKESKELNSEWFVKLSCPYDDNSYTLMVTISKSKIAAKVNKHLAKVKSNPDWFYLEYHIGPEGLSIKDKIKVLMDINRYNGNYTELWIDDGKVANYNNGSCELAKKKF